MLQGRSSLRIYQIRHPYALKFVIEATHLDTLSVKLELHEASCPVREQRAVEVLFLIAAGVLYSHITRF